MAMLALVPSKRNSSVDPGQVKRAWPVSSLSKRPIRRWLAPVNVINSGIPDEELEDELEEEVLEEEELELDEDDELELLGAVSDVLPLPHAVNSSNKNTGTNFCMLNFSLD